MKTIERGQLSCPRAAHEREQAAHAATQRLLLPPTGHRQGSSIELIEAAENALPCSFMKPRVASSAESPATIAGHPLAGAGGVAGPKALGGRCEADSAPGGESRGLSPL
jgi:hypothetical protein